MTSPLFAVGQQVVGHQVYDNAYFDGTIFTIKEVITLREDRYAYFATPPWTTIPYFLYQRELLPLPDEVLSNS